MRFLKRTHCPQLENANFSMFSNYNFFLKKVLPYDIFYAIRFKITLLVCKIAVPTLLVAVFVRAYITLPIYCVISSVMHKHHAD